MKHVNSSVREMPKVEQKQWVKVESGQEPLTSPGPGIAGTVWSSHPIAHLLLALWIGMLTGLGEVFLLAVKKYFLHPVVHVGADIVWMAPLAEVCLFIVPGIILSLTAWRWPRRISLRSAIFLFSFLYFLSLLYMYYTLPVYAKLLLATGLAVQTARFVGRYPNGLYRFVRRTVIWIVLFVVMLGVGVSVNRWYSEHRAAANLPVAHLGAPNVLLIVLDTVRAESMSLYGYEQETTPFLESLAEQGVVFQYAIATSSWTLPTHASLFTGRFNYENLTGLYRPLDATYPTLAEVLGSYGYITGGFVANNWYCSAEHGIARGFAHYEDYVAHAGELARSSSLVRFAFDQAWIRRLLGYYEELGRKPAPRINNNFLRWIDRVPSGSPFFAFLNYFDAHMPYLPPASFAQRFGCTDQLDTFLMRFDRELHLSSNTTTEEVESLRNAYDGTIAYLDYELKRLFGELRQRDLLDRTLVILVSDHGEEFSEHSTIFHGLDLYIQSIRVPLILRLPGIIPANVTVQKPVTLRDIPSTVIDLLDLPDDGLFPGRSLGRYWTESGNEEPEGFSPVLSELNHASWKVGAPVAKGDMKSLIIGDIHYIRNGDGTEEIYDLRHDPAEQNDLVGSPEQQLMIEKFRSSLKAIFADK